MNSLDSLSPSQRQVYDLLQQGQTSDRIAATMGTTLGVIEAQKTRIRNKGITVPGEAAPVSPATHVPIGHLPKVEPLDPPTRSGGSDNDRIAAQLRGKALDADELAKLADKVAGSTARDIHPMILLGIAIQFVKLCGGRMTAHQVIEDVYGALRAMVGDTSPDAGGQTQPLPATEKERLAFLEEQNAMLREQNEKLTRQTRPSYSSAN